MSNEVAMKDSLTSRHVDASFADDDDCDDDCQYIFPQRLMSILSNERNHDAICWLPHGRAFVVRNRKLFSEKIMPRFFSRKSKYSSFTRKLNRWNFVRVSSGPELGAYYHEFFLRDKPHLAAQMFCKNARTKIAMASDVPTPTAASVVSAATSRISTPPPSLSPTEPPRVVKKSEVPNMFARGQPNMDPTLELLLNQPFRLSRPHPAHQGAVPSYALHGHTMNHHVPLPVPSQHQPQDYAQAPLLNLGLQPRVEASFPTSSSSNLWQKIQARKQQEDRMVQLRQLMAMNAHRQQARNAPPNNFRASAA